MLKTAQWRMPPRLVLNARRPGFDLLEGVPQSMVENHNQQQPWELSAQVLRSAFEVNADPGNKRLVCCMYDRGDRLKLGVMFLFYGVCLWGVCVCVFLRLRAFSSIHSCSAVAVCASPDVVSSLADRSL